ncbi:copper resistance protein CopC [Acidiphilium acidophilum]|nr:copper resistance protein CopC [Acidiphilium acidophilum]
MAPGNAKTLIVHLLKSRRAGRYTVLWHALASDGHRTEGRYSFQVAP